MADFADQGQSSLDVFTFFRLLKKKWALISTVTFIVTGAAFLFAFLVEPTYKAKLLLAPVQGMESAGGLSSLASQFGGVASLAGIDLQGGDNRGERSFAILNSRQFTEMFIKQYDLQPILLAEKWNEKAGTWKDKYADNPPSMADAVKFFDRYVRATSRDSLTGFVTVEFEWNDPVVAAEWANNYVDLLNEHLRRIDIQKATKSIEFLRAEYEKTSMKELRGAISNIIEQQIKNSMIANVNDNYAYDILDPAMPTDLDDPSRPKKLLVIFTGFFLGMVLSLVIVLISSANANDYRSDVKV